MKWVIVALSLAQVRKISSLPEFAALDHLQGVKLVGMQAAQGHVPGMGGTNSPVQQRSTVKSFLERSSAQVKSFLEHSISEEASGHDGRDDLLEMSDSESDLLPHLRQLRVRAVRDERDPRPEDPPRPPRDPRDGGGAPGEPEVSSNEGTGQLLPDGRPVFCEHGQPGHDHDVHHSGICAEPVEDDGDAEEGDDGSDGDDPDLALAESQAFLAELGDVYDSFDDYGASPAEAPGPFSDFPAAAPDFYYLDYEDLAPGPAAGFELLRAETPTADDFLVNTISSDGDGGSSDGGGGSSDGADTVGGGAEPEDGGEELSDGDSGELGVFSGATTQALNLEAAPLVNSGDFTEFGDLTYYGGAGENGACSQTFVPEGFTTVAINQPQWADGKQCGTCVEGCFTNGFDDVGERCFKAIIDNLCPECQAGDLDMGEHNGGRWDLSWKFIDCPSSPLQICTEGGNKWYAKIKIQGGPSSVSSLACSYAGKSVEGAYTDDGFFEFWDRTEDTFTGSGMSCELTFSRGGGDTIEITTADLDNKC